MSNQNEIELINAANKECDRLLAKIDELEKKNRALENYKNQSYRIKNQRHEISNRLKENERLRTLLRECKPLFFPYVKDMPLSRCKTLNLLTRINAAIGESEEQNETC